MRGFLLARWGRREVNVREALVMIGEEKALHQTTFLSVDHYQKISARKQVSPGSCFF
jgi:hypothetical protein